MPTPTQRNPLHALTPEREREIRQLLGLADLAFEDEIAIALQVLPPHGAAPGPRLHRGRQ